MCFGVDLRPCLLIRNQNCCNCNGFSLLIIIHIILLIGFLGTYLNGPHFSYYHGWSLNGIK